MKKILLFALVVLLLVSCEEDSNGDISISAWFWVILVGAFVIAIIVAANENKNKEENKSKIITQNNLSNIDATNASYVGWHPDCDATVLDLYCALSGGKICFYSLGGNNLNPGLVFSIKTEAIQNIELEDATSIENKVTLGRLVLVGIFALAWKKKKKNELAFVVVKWNDGRFDHSTIFSCEGENAMQKANSLRNLLIRFAK